MADHRDAAVGQEIDGRRHRLPALQLDRCAAGFLHDPRSAGEGLLGRAFIASERHVDRDQRVPAAAHHRGAMGAHHLHRHRHGRRQAVDHLAQAVADQQHLAMRVEQLRHPHRIGGQHDQRLLGLAVLFPGTDRRNGHPLPRHRRRRRPAGRGVYRESRHAYLLAIVQCRNQPRPAHGPPTQAERNAGCCVSPPAGGTLTRPFARTET